MALFGGLKKKIENLKNEISAKTSSLDELLEQAKKAQAEQNYDKAILFYTKAAEKGDSFAMYQMGCICSNETNKDFFDCDKSFYWFKKSAENDNVNGQTSLGHCFLHGKGVEINIPEAIKWFTKAAEQGNDDAMYNLAHIYGDSNLANKSFTDYDKCFYWYNKSAENGNKISISNVGWCYRFGHGTKKNLAEAIKWFEKANDDFSKKSIEEIKKTDEWKARICKVCGEYIELTSDKCEHCGYVIGSIKCPNCVGYIEPGVEKCKSCGIELNSVETSLKLGVMYRDGKEVDVNIPEAIKWFTKAAEQGSDDAMYSLAHIYGDSNLANKSFTDYDKCFYWYNKSAENGNKLSISNVGWCYRFGHGTKKNLVEAIKWFEKANDDYSKKSIEEIKNSNEWKVMELENKCAEGDVASMCELALLYQEGKQGLTKDVAKALNLYKNAAELGNDNAMNNLAQIYAGCTSENKNFTDYDKCFYWFNKSAENGNKNSIVNVGWCYRFGHGTKKNLVEAIKWFEKVNDDFSKNSIENIKKTDEWKVMELEEKCTKGDATSMCELASLHQNGEKGVPKDITKAIHLYEEAAKLDDDRAMNRLAHIYSGRNTENESLTDYKKCFYWFCKSAKHGNEDSMANLGWCYQSGHGTEKDLEEAIRWFMKADTDWSRKCVREIEASDEWKDLEGIKKGNQGSMSRFAWYYLDGEHGYTKNLNKAIHLYEKIVQSGNNKVDSAMYQLGCIYCDKHNQNTEFFDYDKAFYWFSKGAKSKNRDEHVKDNMAMLGWCYRFGHGTEKDLEEAIRWFKKAEGIVKEIELEFGIRKKDEWIKNSIQKIEASDEWKSLHQIDSQKIKVLIDESNNNAKSCVRLGEIYSTGNGVEQNVMTAIDWYKKAWKLGIDEEVALIEIANLYRQIDKKKAFYLYGVAARKGIHEGKIQLANCYYDGFGTEVDKLYAYVWYQKANDKKNYKEIEKKWEEKEDYYKKQYDSALAQFSRVPSTIGWAVYQDAIRKEDSASLLQLGKEGWLGDVIFYMKNVAKRYASQGNLKKAIECYEKSISFEGDEAIKRIKGTSEWKKIEKLDELNYLIFLGSEKAMIEYADLTFFNKIKGDMSVAIKYYTEFAEKGNVYAMNQLGHYYTNKLRKDDGFCWFKKAADNGSSEALHELGIFFQNGWVVEKDLKKAIELFSKVGDEKSKQKIAEIKALPEWNILELEGNCKENDDKYMCKLGSWYEHGENGLPKDLDRAIYWYQQAAVAGNKLALTFVQTLSQVKQKMDEEGAGDDYTFRWTDKYGDRQEGECWLTKDEYLALLAGGESAIKAYIKSHFYGTSAGVNNVKMFKDY